MSIQQKLLKAISVAQPKLVTLGVGLAITLAIGTAIGMVETHTAYAAGYDITQNNS
jgi:hypothetical protein